MRPALEAAGRAVLQSEHRSLGATRTRYQIGVREDGAYPDLVQLLVFRREGVDAGRHDHAATVIATLRNVLGAGEDKSVGTLQVGREKCPGTIRFQ